MIDRTVIDMYNPTKDNVGEFYKVLNSFYVYAGDMEDNYVQWACRELSKWDPDLTKWMVDNIGVGWKCLDIGSNNGYFVELLSILVGPSGFVWGFEPNKKLVDKYNEAKSLNNYEHASDSMVYDFGLSNENIKTNLVIAKKNVGAALISSDEVGGDEVDNLSIDIKRLDSFFDEHIDFIKMDIEGHEPQAWEGFSEKVKQCNLIVIETGSYHPEEFLRELEKNFTMETISGSKITVEKILKNDLMNLVLRRKNV